jgi:hypothetical protein
MDTHGQQAGRPAYFHLNGVRRSGRISLVTRPYAVTNAIETAVEATT